MWPLVVGRVFLWGRCGAVVGPLRGLFFPFWAVAALVLRQKKPIFFWTAGAFDALGLNRDFFWLVLYFCVEASLHVAYELHGLGSR